MSKRRKPGDWVWLKPNCGFVGESHLLKAEIQPEENPAPCFNNCVDTDCTEWATLLTEPNTEDGKRYMLCHVSECEMLEEPYKENGVNQ